ncbi:unnamed protein product [Symbiodinium necroappetens]|uniref:Uncharacterized protein n=1 Tax=Symbiodinium necroappetens TaxID=1628268 RepID=A0A813BTN9_9DINO|nr:unnamed protein product [Symbiodinium necroappetens]
MSSRRGWTKLTYNNQNLDCSVKVNGHLTDMGGPSLHRNFMAMTTHATNSERLPNVPFVGACSSPDSWSPFLPADLVRRIMLKCTEVVALQAVSNVQVWMGTSDDWIGTSDRPTKVQGVFRGGEFVPSPHGRILRVHSGEEDVFVYSTHPDSHAIILSHYGQWDDVLVRSSAIGSRGGVPSQLRLPRLLHNQTSTPRLQMGPMASTPGSRGPQPFCL